jgi:hypothetical protein
MLADVFKKCWDVKDAVCDPQCPEHIVYVTLKNGGHWHIALDERWKTRHSPTREEMLYGVNVSFESVKRVLTSGCFFWDGDQTPGVTMHGPPAMKVLHVMVSDASAAQKIEEIRRAGLLEPPEMARLLTECPRNEQLVQRVKRLEEAAAKREQARHRAASSEGDKREDSIEGSGKVPPK